MNALNNNTQWGSKQGVEEEKWNKAHFAQEDDDGDYNDGSLRRLVWNHCFVAWRKRELVICKTWKHGNNIPPAFTKQYKTMWTHKFSLLYIYIPGGRLAIIDHISTWWYYFHCLNP